MILIAFVSIIFNGCSSTTATKWNGQVPFAIPISVSGIVIEQTGTQIKAAGVPVKITDSLGKVFTATTSGAPSFMYTTKLDAATGICTLNSVDNGLTFWSWIDGFDPAADTVNVIFNESATSTAPALELVFLDHDRSAMTQALSVNLSEGATQIGSMAVSNGIVGLVTFPNIKPATKYTFTCSNSSGPVSDSYGRPISRSFTTPATLAPKTTVGYTFYMK